MPIYEFFCPDCNTLFNFFSRAVNTSKAPDCPRCKRARLRRQVSVFAAPKKGEKRPDGEGGDGDDLPIDEARMESAVNALAGEAENLSEDDPRQAARLMRKFSKMTGMEFNESVESALGRMEAGEDPERIEEEMGDAMEGEDPFILPGAKSGRTRRPSSAAPRRDRTLYEL